MTYVTTTRARFLALSGRKVNIRYGTPVEQEGDFLWRGDECLCTTTSQNAHQYFTRNDDGNGLERGRLIKTILKSLERDNREYADNSEYQKRWDKVWSDPLCQRYKRADHQDYWLWNHEFYNAPIEDLQYIAHLIGAKEVLK